MTSEQREFRDELFELLRLTDLSPRIMQPDEWSDSEPLIAVERILTECAGAVILAFERMRLPNGKEFSAGEPRELDDVRLPTVWNQIEAAIAYTRGLPVLVIAQNGLRSEGLLENRYDWSVYWSNLSPAELRSEKFRRWFNPWRKEVQEAIPGKSEKFDPGELTLGDIFQRLKVSQVWAVITAVVTFAVAVATVAYRAGAGNWPWK